MDDAGGQPERPPIVPAPARPRWSGPQWSKHTPPRCRDCYYVLTGLTGSKCPECGRAFDLTKPSTYTTNLPLVRWKLWAPGLALAAAVGLGTAGVLLLFGAWGGALWLGVPMGAAVILGYRLRLGAIGLGLTGLFLGIILITGMITLDLGGMFCGMILAVIFVLPMILGVLLGLALRYTLKDSNFTQAGHLSWILAALIPLGWGVIEGRPSTALPLERISTTRTIDSSLDDSWEALMFYEEVEHTPPLILRIGLAHPLATLGSAREPGDVKTCVYNKGRLTKEVTEVEPRRLLAFVVTEQRIGYERDVRLTGGSFLFEAVNEHRTRITLTTEYEPLLTPRFAWRWGERIAVHTLHGHVLEGISRKTGKD